MRNFKVSLVVILLLCGWFASAHVLTFQSIDGERVQASVSEVKRALRTNFRDLNLEYRKLEVFEHSVYIEKPRIKIGDKLYLFHEPQKFSTTSAISICQLFGVGKPIHKVRAKHAPQNVAQFDLNGNLRGIIWSSTSILSVTCR